MKRVYSIDLVRGIVMILMALDHTRDLLHTDSILFQPTDLGKTTAAVFFTRWITHLCAPTFVILAGSSAFLSLKNRADVAGARSFLFTRGLWLIVLEFTLVNFGLWFDVHFNVFLFDVIAAIGFGFIVLSLLISLPARVLGLIGLLIVFLHNLSLLIPGAETSVVKRIGMSFLAPGAFPFGEGKLFVIGYPPLPWLGVMLVGFASGRFFTLATERKKRLFLKLGLASIALFVILRILNVYGDSFSWGRQKDELFTLLSFFNVTKYPPSLDFCLLFLGLMFLVFASIEGVRNRWTDRVCVYGKVPLFYFVVHWYIIHPIVIIMVFLQGFKASDMVFGFNFGRTASGSGLPLWGVYLVWVGVVILIYPLCKWWGRYKAGNKDKRWVRYL